MGRDVTGAVGVLAVLVSAAGCGGNDVPQVAAALDAGRADAGGADAGTSAVDAAVVDASRVPVDAAEPPIVAVTDFTVEVWTWDQTIDACGYSNNGNPFWDWMVVGREPVPAGRYPLFIYLHGTGDVADSPVAISIVDSMAAHGFVAASVPYDSLGGIGTVLADATRACEIADKKGTCLFGSGEGSAITKLCARASVDCSRGIVLGGHSQGAWLATLARDYDSRVRAVWGLGDGIHEHVDVDLGATIVHADSDLGPCMPPSARVLPADRLRVVDGESEYVYGTSLQADVRALTGMDCPPGSLECLRANGSGWTFFPDAANEDGRGLSQHCYMADMPGGDCSASTGLNSHWASGTASYSRDPSLAWLRTFTDR